MHFDRFVSEIGENFLFLELGAPKTELLTKLNDLARYNLRKKSNECKLKTTKPFAPFQVIGGIFHRQKRSSIIGARLPSGAK